MMLALCGFVLVGCGQGSQGNSNKADAESEEQTSNSNLGGSEDAASEMSLEDGTHQVSVQLEGGTGKASIESPAVLNVENGQASIVLVWSSKNYDYMIVDDVKYLNENEGGQSTFTIPLGADKLSGEGFEVIGDTVAMSTPHEITYTLTLTLED